MLLEDMVSLGQEVHPDTVTFNTALKACTNAGRMDVAFEVRTAFPKHPPCPCHASSMSTAEAGRNRHATSCGEKTALHKLGQNSPVAHQPQQKHWFSGHAVLGTLC